MKTILSLVLFLIIGFAGSKGFVRRASSRFRLTGLFVTGMEFFVVGILLGPHILSIITPEVIQDLKPIIYLALGWIGLLFGMEMSWTHLKRVSGSVYQLLLSDVCIILAGFSIAGYLILRWMFQSTPGIEVVFATGIFSLTAAVSSPAIVAIQAKRLPSRGRFTSMVKVATSLGSVLPLLLFGLLYTIVHPGFLGVEGIWKGLLWWIFANIAGIVLGFIMVLFTVERCSENERTLLIVGAVMLLGGLCYYLTLSSLYAAMIMGAVICNFSSMRESIFRQLHEVEKTLFVGILIIVGAMVTFNGLSIILPLVFYIGLRLLLRLFASSWVVGITHPEFKRMGTRSGLIFTAQGGMALALAIEYRMGTSGAFADAVFTVIALAVVLNEVLAFGFARRSFQASGEISPGKSAAGEAGSR
ncbi:MAG: hypothetical protein GTO51_01995 [Candidatus Latescibacteria bacterium]|nr:hypothetical protein [Candidatus Latescibacterota bacterium]NIM64745.1 hypothetical protein [Candidatus Latescibacterota bacterium]NIO01255.1 hypothetical protein [Candidatus Latescibacterota bacterium]NIO27640.1 hypothetical protein [Candidatus Latescibacterota bacterium]NIO55172.1 hypothetical protein [Candidatus Latescibacterota bacterium]